MKSISRRSLLRGAGIGLGASLVSPFLGRLTSAQASAPRRFVFVVEGNGFEPVTVLSPLARRRLDESNRSEVGSSRWWPGDYRHTAPMVIDTPDLSEARSLAALESYDLVDQSTVLFGLSSRIVGGGHSGYHGALSSTRTVGGSPGGQTIDAYLAERLGEESPFDAVRVGVGTGAAINMRTCAAGRGRPLPLLLDPVTAYATLFGAVASGAAGRNFVDRSAILDFARRDVESTQGIFTGGAYEGRKLENYRNAIQVLQGQQARLTGARGRIMEYAPPVPEGLRSGFAFDSISAQFANVTAALQSGLTNVAVIGSGTGGNFGLRYESVSSTGRHDMQHGSSDYPDLLDAVHTVTERHVDLIAEMARTLADTPEESGDGSMLDHTLIVYLGDNGEQHHSTAREFPILLVGGSALGMNAGGRTVVYPGLDEPEHRQLSNLWNTVGYLAGYAVDDFGGESTSRVQEGPLPELLGG